MPDIREREISVIVDEILFLTQSLAAKGIDARDPGDREAYDIICRIERRMQSAKQKEKVK